MTLEQLAVKARLEIKRGDKASKDADKHYGRAGKHLLDAKKEIGHGGWLDWLKRKNINERTAREYMAMAEGQMTAESRRTKNTESHRRSRANRRDVPPISQGGGACDYDWHNPPPSDFENPAEMYKRQAEHYNTEAVHLATAYPLLHIQPSKITRSEVLAVQNVARAWQELSQKIVRHYSEGHPNASNIQTIAEVA